jgi:RNA polymerase sigma-70 factor (ECF subfamily)
MLRLSRAVPEIAGKSRLPLESDLGELSCAASVADRESESSAWDGKLTVFLQVAQHRRGQLLRLANRFTDNREDAEDIVQEALLKAFRHLAQFRGQSKMGTWLWVIVLNAGREWLRQQKGRVFLPLQNVRNEDDDPIEFELPDPGRDPEQSYQYKEMERILLSEIDQLNPVYKGALRMCAIDEFSHVEAAKALGVCVPTIKSRIFHGKKGLKRRVCLRTGMRIGKAVQFDSGAGLTAHMNVGANSVSSPGGG